MSALGQVEKLLTAMTRAEKAQVLQWVSRDVGDALPGIESIPGVVWSESRASSGPESRSGFWSRHGGLVPVKRICCTRIPRCERKT